MYIFYNTYIYILLFFQTINNIQILHQVIIDNILSSYYIILVILGF